MNPALQAGLHVADGAHLESQGLPAAAARPLSSIPCEPNYLAGFPAQPQPCHRRPVSVAHAAVPAADGGASLGTRRRTRVAVRGSCARSHGPRQNTLCHFAPHTSLSHDLCPKQLCHSCYKLGKRRWSYNCVELNLVPAGRGGPSATPIRAETISTCLPAAHQVITGSMQGHLSTQSVRGSQPNLLPRAPSAGQPSAQLPPVSTATNASPSPWPFPSRRSRRLPFCFIWTAGSRCRRTSICATPIRRPAARADPPQAASAD